MHYLELKIPPLLQVLLFALAMWGSAYSAPAADINLPVHIILAIVTGLISSVFMLGGVLAFKRADTTVNPITPQDTNLIVTTGLYCISRNPMYLGFLLALLSWALLLSNALAYAWLPLFIAYMNRFQIQPEERILEEKFGEAYGAYKGEVRRWI